MISGCETTACSTPSSVAPVSFPLQYKTTASAAEFPTLPPCRSAVILSGAKDLNSDTAALLEIPRCARDDGGGDSNHPRLPLLRVLHASRIAPMGSRRTTAMPAAQ